KRLEVGEDLRPAAGDRDDEFRGVALDGVGDGKPDGRSEALQLQRAQRLALRLQLGLGLMTPADHQPPWRLGFEDLARIGDGTAGLHHLPSRSWRPVALATGAEPILL